MFPKDVVIEDFLPQKFVGGVKGSLICREGILQLHVKAG